MEKARFFGPMPEAERLLSERIATRVVELLNEPALDAEAENSARPLQLPLDQLKINDKFVRDINSDQSRTIIVETIISMARHLGLDVVAEGVETEEQARFLHQRGCHRLQGYYFSAALPGEDALRVLGDAASTSRRAPA